MAELRNNEINYPEQIALLEQEILELENKIRHSKRGDWQTFFLACCFLVFFAGISIAEIAGYGSLDSETKGVLIGMMLSVGYFYFDSSKGERNPHK